MVRGVAHLGLTWPVVMAGAARLARPVALGIGALVVIEWAVLAAHAGQAVGVDFAQYRDHVERFLHGGGLYLPWQFDGPYEIVPARVGQLDHASPPLYPPWIVVLVAPFLVLPHVLWWLVPAGVVGYVLWRLQPGAWAWAAIAVLALYPRTPIAVLYGNPVIWATAALAAGMLWRWPAVLVLIKPSLLPFALVGAQSRSWWIALALVAVASLAMLPLWPDFVTAMTNAQATTLHGVDYLTGEWPAAVALVIAGLSRAGARQGPR